MRFNPLVLLLSLTLAGTVCAQSSNPKYIKEQNDHARAVQQQAQAARQQDNRSVNNKSQQFFVCTPRARWTVKYC